MTLSDYILDQQWIFHNIVVEFSVQSKLNFVERSWLPTDSGIVEPICLDVKVLYT